MRKLLRYAHSPLSLAVHAPDCSVDPRATLQTAMNLLVVHADVASRSIYGLSLKSWTRQCQAVCGALHQLKCALTGLDFD